MRPTADLQRTATLRGRDFVLLAWLLLAAQFLSQLHGLGHLDEADQDGHHQEACQLCILSAALDHGGIDTINLSVARVRTTWLPILGCKNFTPKLLPAYLGRAPPLPSSIA